MHKSPLFNSVLPSKVYGIWNGNKKLDEIQASSASEALTLGRKKWGESARAAILQSGKTAQSNFDGRTEPMFLCDEKASIP